MPYRVFLVEDSAPVRERVTAMLASIQGVDNVGSASTEQDAERAILVTQPDAVLLDVKLAQGSGFDVLRSLHTKAPQIEVYMLSNFAAPAYRQLAADLGASGFFDKTNELDAMRKTIADRASHFVH